MTTVMLNSVRVIVGVALGLAPVCAPACLLSQGFTVPPVSADSVVLERTACFGMCPAFRITVRASGEIGYAPLQRSRVGPESVLADSTGVLPKLLRELERAAFYSMPDISRGAEYCKSVATDASTINVSVFSADTTHRRSYYLGCLGSPGTEARPFITRMIAIADSIESIARTGRFSRP